MSNSIVELVWPKILSDLSYCDGLLDGNLFLPKI